ncbi:MAG: isoprenyl transferase [Bacteroidetes bacterium]|nr:isoprenyl transferase [Bacteroidota bacterium]HET6245512.1 isoprenyl transferase [Bacteroidia bacterium]
MTFKEKTREENIPVHVAIIMDGNGRWAKQKGKLRMFGHSNGVGSVKETVETAAEIGVKYLTLYAFSTENWNRPKFEVNALMELLISTINKETATLMKNNIRLMAIGDLSSLPSKCFKELNDAMEKTASNTQMTLVLALSYSSRWEITQAVKKITAKVQTGELSPEDISEDIINKHLCTAGIPDPELLIRTSGELRISNFLMWQISYSELYFTQKLWPDFRKNDFLLAIADFQKRERRFGKTSEQIKSNSQKV